MSNIHFNETNKLHPVYNCSKNIKNSYLDILCMVAQYQNIYYPNAEAYIKNISSQIKSDFDVKSRLKKITPFDIDIIEDFCKQCRNEKMEKIFFHDFMFVISADNEPVKKQIELSIRISEWLGLNSDDIQSVCKNLKEERSAFIKQHCNNLSQSSNTNSYIVKNGKVENATLSEADLKMLLSQNPELIFKNVVFSNNNTEKMWRLDFSIYTPIFNNCSFEVPMYIQGNDLAFNSCDFLKPIQLESSNDIVFNSSDFNDDVINRCSNDIVYNSCDFHYNITNLDSYDMVYNSCDFHVNIDFQELSDYTFNSCDFHRNIQCNCANDFVFNSCDIFEVINCNSADDFTFNSCDFFKNVLCNGSTDFLFESCDFFQNIDCSNANEIKFSNCEFKSNIMDSNADNITYENCEFNDD